MKAGIASTSILAAALLIGWAAYAAEPASVTVPTAELAQALMSGKDDVLPKTFSIGRGIQVLGDYVYVSGRAGGVIQYFKRDVQTGKLTYVDSVTHSSLKATFSLHAAGGRLYALGLFVWGSADGDKYKGVTWFDIEPSTGKPVEKGTLPDLVSSAWFQQLIVGPGEKDLYGCFAGQNLKLVWFRLGADGAPEKRGEISGAGISAASRISPDGRFIYTVGDQRIAIVERKPTGEIAYVKALSLEVLAPAKGPDAVNWGDLRPALAGISPDGRWLYVELYSEQPRTRSLFGIFKRDPATGELAFSEGGSSADPQFSKFASLESMNLHFAQDGQSGFLFNSRGLLQVFRIDPNTGRLRIVSDVVLGKAEENKCRPCPVMHYDAKNGFLFGAGVWQTGSYGENFRGVWSAKTGTVKVGLSDERTDLKCAPEASASAKVENPDDWPRWRGPNGDGKCSLKGIRKDFSGGLRKVWEVTGLSPGDCTWSAPAIQGNKLVVMGTHGFMDEVFCFDADKGGRPLWSIDLPSGGDSGGNSGGRDGWCGGPVAMPCISGDKIYVSQGGRFSCLNLADGKVLWTRQVAPACHVYAASPLVWDDMLIVPGLYPPEGKSNLLSGLKKDTGEQVWTYGGEVHGGDSPLFGHVSPARVKINGVEQVLYNTGALACGMDPRTGKTLWEYKIDAKGSNVNASCPVTDGSIVAVMLGDGQGSPLAVQIEKDASTNVLWSKTPGFRAMWSDPILKDGCLYTFSSDGLYCGPNSDFRCVDLKTGQAKWIEKKTGCGSVLEVDGCLLCLTYTGDLWLLNPTPEGFRKITEWKGAIKQEPWWTASGGKSPAPCWTIPVIARGKLYLRYSNTLTCYDLTK